MAVQIDGKLVTDAEARRMKKQINTPKKEKTSIVGKECWWIDENLKLYEGTIVEESITSVVVSARPSDIRFARPEALYHLERELIRLN